MRCAAPRFCFIPSSNLHMLSSSSGRCSYATPEIAVPSSAVERQSAGTSSVWPHAATAASASCVAARAAAFPLAKTTSFSSFVIDETAAMAAAALSLPCFGAGGFSLKRHDSESVRSLTVACIRTTEPPTVGGKAHNTSAPCRSRHALARSNSASASSGPAVASGEGCIATGGTIAVTIASVSSCTDAAFEAPAGVEAGACPYPELADRRGAMKVASISAAQRDRAASHARLVEGSAYRHTDRHFTKHRRSRPH